MKRPVRIILRLTPLLLLIITVIFRIFLSDSPTLQNWYYQRVFYAVRDIQDSISGSLPFAALYYLPAIVLALQIWLLPRFPKLFQWRFLLKAILRTVNLWSVVVVVFFWCWGFNYSIDHLAKAEITPVEPNARILKTAYHNVMSRAFKQRSSFADDSLLQMESFASEAEIEEAVQTVLQNYSMHTAHEVPMRKLKPAAILRRLGISGIYNPFSGEANIDSGLDPLNELFTAAHEFAHAYGIAGEAEANFVAFLACHQLATPKAKYAADYVLWRYVAYELIISGEDLTELPETPDLLMQDRKAIRQLALQYPTIWPELSEQVNDTYLKSQGIESGVKNYSAFILLVFNEEPELLK